MKPSPCLKFRFACPVAFLLAFWLTGASGICSDTPLEISMQRIKKAYKELATDLEKPEDANKSTYLSLAETIRTSAVKSRGLIPEMANKLPPDQQAAMVKSYVQSMDNFVGSIDVLIRDLQSGKWDEGRKDMATLKDEMKSCHREFREDD